MSSDPLPTNPNKPAGDLCLSPEQLKLFRAQQERERMIQEIMFLRNILARVAADSPGGEITFDLAQGAPTGNIEVVFAENRNRVWFKFHRVNKETSPICGPGGQPIVHETPVQECPGNPNSEGGHCFACSSKCDCKHPEGEQKA